MDSKQFITALAERSGHATATANILVEKLTSALVDFGMELDAVAVPGFGTFTTSKHDEMIIEDRSTGKRTLLPPEIRMEFKPSILLRKKL